MVLVFFLFRLHVSAGRISGVVVFYLVLAGIYLLFFLLIRKRQAKTSVLLFSILFGTGLICRLMLFGLSPEVLSDDVYRYLWDGKVQNAGINPYLYAPDDPLLAPLQNDSNFKLINHPELPTSYPPLAQHFFRLLYSVAGWNVDGVRLVYLALDLFCFILIFQMTGRRITGFLYWLSPLVVIETALGLHIDILGAALMVCTLWFLTKRRIYPALACFAASVLTKYIFLAAAPVLLAWYAATGFSEKGFSTFRKTADIGLKIAVFAAVIVCISLPFLKAGRLLFQQLVFYIEYWEFNAPFYSLLRHIFPHSHVYIRGALLAAGTVTIACIKKLTLYDRIRLSILLLLLLNGVLYPWYLLWLVPFFAFGDRWGELALISIIPISYSVLIGYKASGVWMENRLITAVQYIPFLLFFIIDIWKGHYVQREKNRGNYSGPQRGRFTTGGS